MNIKHGQKNTRLYRIWCAMKYRCKKSKYYTRKGITICQEWQNDFKAFYDWAMANGYNDNLSIDRINNKGNYEPSNCRWETFVTQANNKSNNHYGEVFGEKLTLAGASKKYDINYSTLRSRVNRDGMTLEEAVLCGKATLVRNEKNGRYERMVI